MIIVRHQIRAVRGDDEVTQTACCIALSLQPYALLGYTCSFPCKPFCPVMNFLLSHAIFTFILSQHLMVNFSRFHFLCLKKSHFAGLFSSSAILQQSIPCFFVFFTSASAGLRAECCMFRLTISHCKHVVLHQLLCLVVTT